MIRCYQIDIMGAFGLQLQKNIRKAFYGDEFTVLPGSNGSVLAENASDTAAGKKDGTGTVFTGNTGFFPHV